MENIRKPSAVWTEGFWIVYDRAFEGGNRLLTYVLILVALYVGWLLYEKWANDRALASFRHVIHVNGIRGKTSVCRLIDAHLRGAGYKVFTKTTGSTPFYIDVSGREHEIRRHGGANVHEQLSMIRRARKEGAEVLILECMAVQPELQRTAQEQIVKADMVVITNVRYDHIFEMGDRLEDIAESLSGTVPRNGVLFTADPDFFGFFQEKCRERGSEAVLCREGPWTENESIAVEVGKHLGIPEDSFRDHVQDYQEDFGACKLYELPKGPFLNLFSVNDPQSTKKRLDEYQGSGPDTVFLYNHREDRPDRLLLFIRHFFPLVEFREILVMGENRGQAVRLLKKAGFDRVRAVKDWHEALEGRNGELLVGLGNIKGGAYDMLEYLEGEDRHE